MKSFIITIVCLHFVCTAQSQRIKLETYSVNKQQRFYSLNGAELLLVAGEDTFFLTKENKMQFLITNLSFKEDTSIKSVKLLLQTCKFIYTVNLPKEDFSHPLIKIGFYKEGRKAYELVELCSKECMSLVSDMVRQKR